MVRLTWIDRLDPELQKPGTEWKKYPYVRDYVLVVGGRKHEWSLHFHCGLPMHVYHNGEWARCIVPWCQYDHLLVGGCEHGGLRYGNPYP